MTSYGFGQEQNKETSKMRILLLGTGTPTEDPEHSGPSTAIVVNGTPYLVDFGTGIVRQSAAARKKGVQGLEPVNLRIGLLTHLHSDHILGFPDLILTPWIVGRKEPLEVYGPPGTRDIHEVYTSVVRMISPEWKQYRLAYHTSSKELAEIATKAMPGLLIFTIERIQAAIKREE
jgi:ribonuclease BN (tRNA processing enzyme)